jgi:hypothetical protein
MLKINQKEFKVKEIFNPKLEDTPINKHNIVK